MEQQAASQTFAQLLEELRLARGILKRELAARAGLSNAYVSLLTRGRKDAPSEAVVAALVEALALDSARASELYAAAGIEQGKSRRRGAPREQVDWGAAPNVDAFCGRSTTLKRLERWVAGEECRLVSVLGMGGVGKTSLCVKLAQRVAQHFDRVVWRSMLNAPAWEDTVGELFELLGGGRRHELPMGLEHQISLLVGCLQKRRCLVIFDNVESLLQAHGRVGHFRPELGGYAALLRRVGETHHRSCVVLTSREKAHPVGLLEATPEAAKTLVLGGLDEHDARQMLELHGLSARPEDWARFVDAYSGNPLALKLAAEAIRELFGGDVRAFLAGKQFIFGDISELLNRQFDRFEPLEQAVLYWLAIERAPASIELLQNAVFGGAAQREVLDALLKLRRRCWIEEELQQFSLQNVVLEYLTERLVGRICDEIRTRRPVLLHSHALIRAHGKQYVRASQTRNILQPIVDQLRRAAGADALLQALRELISEAQRSSDGIRLGYLGGNAANLLAQLGEEIRGWDFSGISLRQAYLADVPLPECDLAGADVSTSVFSDALAAAVTVAISPDDTSIAVGTMDGRVHVWGLSDRRQSAMWVAHDGPVFCVHFTPDGQGLWSAGDDCVIRNWDLSTLQCRRELRGHTRAARALALDPHDQVLASASEDETARVWLLATQRVRHTLRGHRGRVWSVAVSRRRQIATGGADHEVRLWGLESGEHLRTLQGHEGWVWTVDFSSDGRWLASGSDDKTVRLWEAGTGRCVHTLRGHRGAVRAVAFSPTGHLLASAGEDGRAWLWDPLSGHCVGTLEGQLVRAYAVAWGGSGALLGVCGDRDAELWDARSRRCLRSLHGHMNRVWSVHFSPDSRELASGSDDGTVRLWRVEDGKCAVANRGHRGTVPSVAFEPSGSLVASAGDDGTLRLWPTRGGVAPRVLAGHELSVRCAAFSPDGAVLASGSFDETLRLWDVSSGRPVSTLIGHGSAVWTVAFSPDGCLIASGADDGTILLWRTDDGRVIERLTGHDRTVRSVTFHPDGNLLASASDDQTVRFWDPRSGRALETLAGHVNRVWSVAFSPNGRLLASAGDDHSARLWDVSSRQCVTTLQGHENRIFSLAFSPDGRLIATGSCDETIKVWEADTGVLVHTLTMERPYEGMSITGAKGLNPAQREALKLLGAIDSQ